MGCGGDLDCKRPSLVSHRSGVPPRVAIRRKRSWSWSITWTPSWGRSRRATGRARRCRRATGGRSQDPRACSARRLTRPASQLAKLIEPLPVGAEQGARRGRTLRSCEAGKSSCRASLTSGKSRTQGSGRPSGPVRQSPHPCPLPPRRRSARDDRHTPAEPPLPRHAHVDDRAWHPSSSRLLAAARLVHGGVLYANDAKPPVAEERRAGRLHEGGARRERT